MTGRSIRINLKSGLSTLMHVLPFRLRGRAGTKQHQAGPANWAQTSWGRKFIKSATLVLALFCSASLALADMKITTKSSASGQSTTMTTYIKGARQRIEGVGYITIYQCDLKRMIQINDKTKSYLVTPFSGASGAAAASSGQQKSGAKRGGVVTYTTTATDTGERKEILGMKARRVKSKMVVQSSEGACNSMNMEMETDGWYIDMPGGQNCQSQTASTYDTGQSDCVDEVRYKTEGYANTGYPASATTTIKFNMGEGAPSIPSSTSTQEVTEISTSALEQSLFEVPAGYKEVKSSQELGSPY
ncbi:MAG TPA: hypothetical protein VJS44_02350 [Pyrinomonadaceae bacterium]|nr:hypothetical protein [Pyrinomonadaceae bacterium]